MSSKEFVEFFNKNKNIELYKSILNENFKENEKCRICDDVIYYYDSTFTFKNKKIYLKGKSYKSSKFLNKEYKLTVCESCLTKKFPEYSSKNKSRVFNQMNYITEFAFNIDHDVAVDWMKSKYAITEENLIKKWGDEIGRVKWISYKNKQSLSNKYEYKKEKHGWSEEKFNEYNKSRSVTLKNLINKHGEEKGLKMWISYCERQKYTTTIEYFVEKYGKVDGEEKYNNFCKNRLLGCAYSKLSKNLFDELLKKINENYETYYGDKEWFLYDNLNKKYYLIDFFIKDLNIGIEFNGDIWHANPDIFSDNFKFPFDNKINASDIWKKDKIKNDFLKTKLDKLIIIWESDLKKDGIENTINKILKEL